MPKLSDYVQKLNDTTESTESTDDGLVSGLAQRITNRLFGLNGVERYQLWPERVIRSGATVAGDVMSGKEPLRTVDPITGELTLSPQLIGRNLDAAALMGTGGLAGTGAAAGEKALTSQMLKPQEVTLGAGPFLRPALKFKDRIYKAPPNGQHLDALPPEMAYEFQRAAMRGDDISNYNFGFMNHKGQFLSREAALDYAIKEGLLHPNSEAARAGTLTSTMDLMADSSKPAIAIKSLEKPSTLNNPEAPNLTHMMKSRVEEVPLDKVRDPQGTAMDWTALGKRKEYDPLIKGFDDKPIAVRKENGEYLIYDGRHRTVMDINNGAKTKKMYVLDAKDYDPANAGIKPAPNKMSDEELLKRLLGD